MESLTIVFLALVVMAALLCAIAIGSPRRTAVRVAALVLTATVIPLGYAALSAILAKPKPVSHEWALRDAERATLLGVSFDEGNAIYVWLAVEGLREPRYYSLPWRTELAERLQMRLDEALEQDSNVIIERPFRRRRFDDLSALNLELVRPPSLPQKPRPARARVFAPGEGRY